MSTATAVGSVSFGRARRTPRAPARSPSPRNVMTFVCASVMLPGASARARSASAPRPGDPARRGGGGEIPQHAVSECGRLRGAGQGEREGVVAGDGLLVVADGPPQAGQVERVAPLRGRLALQERVVCREARGRSLGERVLGGWREGQL